MRLIDADKLLASALRDGTLKIKITKGRVKGFGPIRHVSLKPRDAKKFVEAIDSQPIYVLVMCEDCEHVCKYIGVVSAEDSTEKTTYLCHSPNREGVVEPNEYCSRSKRRVGPIKTINFKADLDGFFENADNLLSGED